MTGLERRTIRPTAWTLVALMLLVAAFVLDCASGNEVASSLFYMVGIAVAAWFVGPRTGIVIACSSAVAWGLAVHLVGPAFSKTGVLVWNLGVELAIYLATAAVLGRIHRGLQAERRLVEQLNAATAALTREAQAVGELQREMLPPSLPEIPGYEWLAYYSTSSHAGGDYYDFFPLPGGRVGVLVADASGHGPQAAMLMAMLRVLLHTANEGLAEPDLVLFRLGRQIAQTVPPGRFATACFAVLEPSSGRIQFSLAGHPPPLILRSGEGTIEELPLRGGPPLGLPTERPFDAGEGLLRPGDTLILYTDGVTESPSPAHELFGAERLRAAIESASALTLVELRNQILARLEAHTAGGRPEDDVTLLMLRRSR